MINPEINLGSLISGGATVFTILALGFGFYFKTLFDNKIFKQDIGDIKSDLKILNKLVTDIALQNQRLDNQGERMNVIDRHIDELRRGEGFIRTNGKEIH